VKSILIASLDNWDSCAEVPYIFKKAGFSVSVFCRKGDWLMSNKFHDQWIQAPKDLDSYINALLNVIHFKAYTLIIIADEPLLKALNEKIEDPEIFIKVLPLIKFENRMMLSSKTGFSKFCIENNLLTPRYTTYESPVDFNKIIQTLKFPLINKNEFSWGGTDMCITNNEIELSDLLKQINTNQTILFQEFIEGEEIRVDAFFYQGKLKAYFCAKVLTYDKGRFTYNTRRIYYNNPEIKSYLIELGEKSGTNGFANINYIQEKATGKLYLIEMDLRVNSWLAYSEYLSKENFITCFKNIANNELQIEPKNTLYKEEIEIALFYKDLRRALHQKDFKGISRWLLIKISYWKFLPLYDLKLSKLIFKKLLNEFFINRIKIAYSKVNQKI
jgi:predicted ATP-grasp superfamily ATP-dependent carboligase